MCVSCVVGNVWWFCAGVVVLWHCGELAWWCCAMVCDGSAVVSRCMMLLCCGVVVYDVAVRVCWRCGIVVDVGVVL